MSSAVLKLTGYDAEEYFRELRSRQVRHTKAHDWHTPSKLPWLTYCEECGLAWSNNKRTQKLVKQGCVFYRLKQL